MRHGLREGIYFYSLLNTTILLLLYSSLVPTYFCLQAYSLFGKVADDFFEAREEMEKSSGVIKELRKESEESTHMIKDLDARYNALHSESIEDKASLEAAREENKMLREMVANFEANYVHREKFLRSGDFKQTPEFNEACGDMMDTYFEHGFKGCLSQLRANGYSPEEHPFPFLNSDKAFEDIPEDEEEEGQRQEKQLEDEQERQQQQDEDGGPN